MVRVVRGVVVSSGVEYDVGVVVASAAMLAVSSNAASAGRMDDPFRGHGGKTDRCW